MNPNDLATAEITEIAKSALEKPSDFGWFGRDEMFETWGWSGITQNRDSGNIDRSNFAVAQRLLKEQGFEEGEDWEEIGMGHWAVGHVDSIIVKILNDDYVPMTQIKEEYVTPVFKYCVELLRGMYEDYPILDEMHYSDLEWEDTLSNIKWEAPSTVKTDDESINEICQYLMNEGQGNQDDRGMYWSRQEIEEAAWYTGTIEEEEWDDWMEWLEERPDEAYQFRAWVEAVNGQTNLGI